MASIRSLLYPVDLVEGREPEWLEAALSAAVTFKAHLEVLHSQVNPTQVMNPGVWGLSDEAARGIAKAAEQFMADNVERVERELATLAKRLQVPLVADSRAAGDGASVSLRAGEPGLRSTMVSMMGRVADLVLVRQPTETGLTSATLAAAMKETGHPVLMLPRGCAAIAAGRVGVAWNGRVEVARAVAGSLPILRQASEVHVLSSRKRSTTTPTPAQLGEYLALHGIAAQTHTLEADGPEVAGALLGEAQRLGLDLMVAGAYSHARMRDVVFGGVTRRILLDSRVPLVMAH